MKILNFIFGIPYVDDKGKYRPNKIKVYPAGCDCFEIIDGPGNCGKVKGGLSINFPYIRRNGQKIYCGGVIHNQDVAKMFLMLLLHLIRLPIHVCFHYVYNFFMRLFKQPHIYKWKKASWFFKKREV